MSRGPDWDALYRDAEGGLFGEAPNEYLRMVLARTGVAPRTALCIADGDGRNGTFLAGQGLSVTTVDLSAEATRRAAAHDRAAGASVERIVADLTDWRTDRRFDLVALLYLQGPPDLRRAGVELGAKLVGPGGWFVLEGFGRHRWSGGRPGASAPENRYMLDEIRGWLRPLCIVEALEGTVALAEGSRHEGEASVVRVLARR